MSFSSSGIDNQDVNEFMNKFVQGKTINRIDYHDPYIDCITIHFSDGSRLVLSTLGGVELEEPEFRLE